MPPGGQPSEEDAGRTVYLNDATKTHNSTKAGDGFCTNVVITSKYTALNFLPRNIYQQFLRGANFYFLMIGVLQCIPRISPLGTVRPTILFPLVIVLAASAFKEALEDWRRHQQDKQVNNKIVDVLRNGEWQPDLWANLLVGDIVRIKRDEFIPADVVMFASDNEFGLAYVETANLDGETNLKPKQALQETCKALQETSALTAARGSVRCEDPNNRLYNFDGSFTDSAGKTLPLSPVQLLLRGCALRNTKWVTGLIVNTGNDTKLMRNLGESPMKRSNVEKLTNKNILIAFATDLTLCIILSIGNSVWTQSIQDGAFYLALEGDVHLNAFLQILTNMINFNGLIPISLYVSMELVKLAQVYFMKEDVQMYCDETDTPCQPRTSNLNEELGQVQYIFSDKTGTLTRNVMEFKCASIKGIRYEVDSSDTFKKNKVEGASTSKPDPNLPVPMSKAIELVKYDRDDDRTIQDFFLVLSLCQDVIVERDDGAPIDEFKYQASSPDENALVMAARNVGFVFLDRTPSTVTCEIMGEKHTFELLNMIAFSSARKRMSVIVRDPRNSKIYLYCKGADNIIQERCKEASDGNPNITPTLAHLEEYAEIGLRTLILAKKELTEEEWSSWNEKMHEASVAIVEREAKVEAAAELIEQGMICLGGTAIEDRLQDNVPETIEVLAQAGIKLWVLTGDKQTTAINIGMSARIITKKMEIMILNEDTADGCKKRIEELAAIVSRTQASAANAATGTGKGDAGGATPGGNPDSGLGTGGEDEDDGMFFGGVGAPAQGPPRGTCACGGDDIKLNNLSNATSDDLLELCLVVDGHTLTGVFETEELKLAFLNVAKVCKSVICCRVSPLQKALVVRLVKDNMDIISLAIGDGANDVTMIQAAHLGIGISGKEGLQATLASDYAIAQFQFLHSLLLVHGRWAYRRIAQLIVYSFYKNFTFVLGSFFYGFFCGFSGPLFYDDILDGGYNVAFTGLPIIFFAALDQDIPAHVARNSPWLYIAGQQEHRFNKKVFVSWLANGCWHSFLCFFGALFTLRNFTDPKTLTMIGPWDLGTVTFAGVVLTVTTKLMMESNHWTWLHITVWALHIAAFFAFSSLRSALTFPDELYADVFPDLLNDPAFWLYCGMIPVLTVVIRDMPWKYVKRRYNPEPNHLVQRQHQKARRIGKKLRHFERKEARHLREGGQNVKSRATPGEQGYLELGTKTALGRVSWKFRWFRLKDRQLMCYMPNMHVLDAAVLSVCPCPNPNQLERRSVV